MPPYKPFVTPAISFRGRSPFETRQTPGIPPQSLPAPVVSTQGDIVSVNGIPLPPGTSGTPSGAFSQSAQEANPDSVFLPQQYGDYTTFPIVFAGAGEQLVLARPNAWRGALLIQNLTVVANIHYCFDRPADNVSCVAINAGGNRVFDNTVPQGDLHIFSTGAGIVIIEYMNRDITKTVYR